MLAAANFAMDKDFTASEVSFVITYAAQQVVAGMNYELNIDITSLSSNTCETYEFKVFRALNQSYFLSAVSNLGACE